MTRPPFSLDLLRRRPEVEAPGLVAVDAADRLILDESAELRGTARRIAVIGDEYGALTLTAADAGATGIRVHQDPLAHERALHANADAAGLSSAFESMPLGPDLVRGADLVLMRLPRSLDALEDIAGLIAAHADPGVVVGAGGRIKHMSLAMNEVLRRFFGRLDVSHARQKARVLFARVPLPGAPETIRPREATHPVPGLAAPLTVCAFGGAFAGASIDIGTRFLLEQLAAADAERLIAPDAGTLTADPAGPPATPDAPAPGDVIDFACGTGVVATWLALRHPSLTVIATDQSASAVASALSTAAANGVADRVEVHRDLGLSARADNSAGFIALNPPFHAGAAIPGGVAEPLFADAGRVLRPGGQLWTVWNSPLRYRPALERLVGPTRQVARNPKFTVTVSTKR